MRISVCVPTYRLGGVDVLHECLSRQTFRDFELVLVDALCDRRRDLVAERMGSQYRVVHGPPAKRNFPWDALANYRNSALARASGELLLWLVDYSVFPEEFLARHWRFFEDTGNTVCLATPHRYYVPPAFRGGVPWWAPQARLTASPDKEVTYAYDEPATVGYAEEIQSGQWDEWLWSIFEAGVTFHEAPPDLVFGVDPKTHVPTVTTDGRPVHMAGHFTHWKSESVPREALIRANGFDETFDGGHSFDDTDGGERLFRLGVRWQVFQEPTVNILNVRHYFPHLRRTMDHRAMEGYYRESATRPTRAANRCRMGHPVTWWA